MPRIRVNLPVSIPADLPPVCPRCLDVDPGMPSGADIPNPSAEDLCTECAIVCAQDLVKERGPLAKSTSKITERLAPHAIAVRPMQVHPRPGYDGSVDGPLRMAHGPRDFDGLGRERFWDQSPEERATALPAMVEDAGRQLDKLEPKHWKAQNENRIFAKGWLAELYRARSR